MCAVHCVLITTFVHVWNVAVDWLFRVIAALVEVSTFVTVARNDGKQGNGALVALRSQNVPTAGKASGGTAGKPCTVGSSV